MSLFNERPLRGRFCWFCAPKPETSFANDPNPNSFDLSDYSPKPQYETYPCELYENDSHYGYDCPPRFSFVYEQEPSDNQNYNDNYYPHISSSFLCCENYGGHHESFKCQSMNQNYVEPNPCYNFGFDQIQTPQQFVIHQPQEIPEVIPFIESKEWIETKNEFYKMMEAYTERMSQQREQEALLAVQREQKLRKQKQPSQEKEEPPQNSDFHQLIGEIYGTKVCEEQNQNMEDTMLELIKVCRQKELFEVENIIEQLTKRRTRITESLKNFKVIHNESSISLNNMSQIPLVIAIAPVLPIEEPEYSLSMGDEHLSTILEIESDEVIKFSVENLVPIPSESEVTFDNEKIISTQIDPHYFNAESNLIEYLLNRDTLIDYSPKFDYLLEEFSGEIAHIDPIPPGIKEVDFDLEEEIYLVKNLLYDNSSPRLPKDLNAKIVDTTVESLSQSPILIEDSDSQMEEIDLFLATDDLMPPSIENDDYDSKGDIHFLKELLSNDTLPLPGVLTAKMVEDIFEHHVLMPKVLPSQPTLCLNIDTLLSFSFENEDKVFKPGILSYLLVSHRDKITSDFSESPMMTYGEEIPLVDVSFLHFYPPRLSSSMGDRVRIKTR
uniref:Reverse transcriptase domain-containing protein n=1 Tax=Tanacetum cinerariifolium TaxID=118510 RepID=A0A699HH61_TANCI|nr:hypothetical protein [Tanacetum cinerariifolium]